MFRNYKNRQANQHDVVENLFAAVGDSAVY
jgi:hypothetical protein